MGTNLQQDKDFIILPSNKSLGPRILEQAKYIWRVLAHLADDTTYRRLSPADAKKSSWKKWSSTLLGTTIKSSQTKTRIIFTPLFWCCWSLCLFLHNGKGTPETRLESTPNCVCQRESHTRAWMMAWSTTQAHHPKAPVLHQTPLFQKPNVLRCLAPSCLLAASGGCWLLASIASSYKQKKAPTSFGITFGNGMNAC
jgi:hypothetical protein